MALENEHTVKLMNQQLSLSTLALGAIMVGVLMPAVIYGINLRDPSPTELLISICISLFSGVVFLWVLDATSVLRFRAEWIAKSVYGAAISSVLGTSVAVYSDSFTERKFEYEGLWEIQIRNVEQNQFVADDELILHYSTSNNSYYGFSRMRAADIKNPQIANWFEVVDFQPKDSVIMVKLTSVESPDSVYQFKLKRQREGKVFKGNLVSGESLSISMTRPR
nr:hypothetical protein [uncultured Vibrio sp.]